MVQRRRNTGSNKNKKLPTKAILLIASVVAISLFQMVLYILLQTGNFDKVDALYETITHTTDQIMH